MTTRNELLGKHGFKLAHGSSAKADTADDASLEKIVARFGALAPDEAVGWGIALARKISALHEVGGIHGGISAGCVLLQSPDRGVLLHHLAPRRPAYHAPERIETRRISTADDVFAIGATLHVALTTQLPPRGKLDLGDRAIERLLEEALCLDADQRVGLGSLIAMLEGWCTPAQLSAVPRLDEGDGELDQALPTLPREQIHPLESTLQSAKADPVASSEGANQAAAEQSPRSSGRRARAILIGLVLIAIGVAFLLFGRQWIENPRGESKPAGALVP